MKDYLTIGSTPSGEKCAQVGTEHYHEQSIIETTAFKEQLKRVFGDAPYGARFTVKSFPHDFGSYSEVCIVYDDSIEDSANFAYKVENETPEFWDNIAKNMLKSQGYIHLN